MKPRSIRFAVAGVTSVFMVDDFVTVLKSPDVGWAELKPRVRAAILDAT